MAGEVIDGTRNINGMSWKSLQKAHICYLDLTAQLYATFYK